METLDASYADARPAMTSEDALRIVGRLWGWEGSVEEVASERDAVFRVSRPSGEVGDPSGEVGYLKVSGALESRAALDVQTDMLEALAGAQTCYQFPDLIPTREGAASAVEVVDGEKRFVRLLKEVPGVPVGEVRPQGTELLFQLGRLIGTVDRSVSDVTTTDRAMVWDLRGGPELIRRNLGAVADPARRGVLESILRRFDEHVAPRIGDLRESVIYNDANLANLYVDPSRMGTPKVIGLVDFGDAIRSWTVADLAVACAYAGCDKVEPVAAFCWVARGYTSEFALTEVEADVVYELARIRLALSVTISSVRARQDPGNEYLLTSQAGVWQLLDQLTEISADLARYRLREACGHEPCPTGPRVVAALKRAAKSAGPVLDPDPRTATTVVIDASIESGDDGGTFDPTDHTTFSRAVFDTMRNANAPIGIGRFDEVRWWYTGDAFRTPRDDVAEWRTVHLGVDLFAEAGTPVRCPLAGRVASVHDNADRLDYGPTVIVEHELEDDEGPLRFWTLYGHLNRETLEATVEGQSVAAGDRIGAIGGPPGNGDWAPHLHFQIFADPLGYEGTFPGIAAPSQRATWLSVSPDPNHLLNIPGEVTAPRPGTTTDLIAGRERRLGPSLSLSYDRPLHIVRGRGARLFDGEGQPYLDCVNNVAHVGHSHPRLAEAAARQMRVLNTNTRYLHETILEYADRLTALFPDPLNVCFLVNSGTEANELALRIARTHTKKVGAVVLDGAYHGNSSSVINLSSYKFNGPGGKGLRPWVRMAAMPDCYRGLYRGSAAEVAPLYADEVRQCLDALETERTWFEDRAPGAAAFFHESMLSCGGQIPLPKAYLASAYGAARTVGALCVADEVQVGFGRVGSSYWAFEEHGVVPDIVTLGKPIGNGHPLGAVITTAEIARSFDNGMEYFNTYGGNPVSCAIGLAVLDVIEDEGLRQNAARVGGRLLEDLEALKSRHASLGDVRGRGFFLGLEFVRDGLAANAKIAEGLGANADVAGDLVANRRVAEGLVQRMRDRGILLGVDGPDRNVIKFKPPMVFSEADANLLVSTLDDVLSETAFLK